MAAGGKKATMVVDRQVKEGQSTSARRWRRWWWWCWGGGGWLLLMMMKMEIRMEIYLKRSQPSLCSHLGFVGVQKQQVPWHVEDDHDSINVNDGTIVIIITNVSIAINIEFPPKKHPLAKASPLIFCHGDILSWVPGFDSNFPQIMAIIEIISKPSSCH